MVDASMLIIMPLNMRRDDAVHDKDRCDAGSGCSGLVLLSGHHDDSTYCLASCPAVLEAGMT